MMIINDFCAPIALAATLSMAFVAAESVKSYTSFLCERFFKFQDFVKSSFDECRSLLTDSETLNHLDVAEIGDGKTTVSEIEALKRERESLQKEIDKTAEEKQKRLPAVCEAESMSSICLFVFLINTVYLTREDLDKIMAVDLSKYPAGYEQARDIFMIGVWTAQRVSDYNNIKKEDFSTLTKNIMREEEDPNEPGNKIAWIEKQEITYVNIRQQKTGAKVSIPCNSQLKAILEKYDYQAPHLVDQVINRYIKEIAQAAGLTQLVEIETTKGGTPKKEKVEKYKLIHTHTARRTGATLMYLAGLDLYDIMKVTGHTSPKMLKKYIKADSLEVVEKLTDKYEYFR